MKKAEWKFYQGFYKGALPPLILGLALALLQSGIVLPISLLIKTIFDGALPQKNLSQLILFCVLIFFLYVLDGGFTLWTRHLSLTTTKKAIREIRDEIIGKLYSLPRSYYQNTDLLRLHASIVQDTSRVDIMSNALVAQLIPASFVCAGLGAILIYLNGLLFLIMTAILPILYILNRLFGKTIKKKVRLYHNLFELFSKRVQVLLDNLDLTLIHSAEKTEKTRQGEIHDTLRKISGSQAWFSAAYRITQKTMIFSFGVIILVFGGWFVIKENMSVGELIAYFAAVGLLRNNLLTIFNVIPQILEGNESLSRLYSFFLLEKKLPYAGKNRINFQGKIQFDGVDFQYNGRQILFDVSFKVNPQEITAFIGPNGAGKTTIIHLILGFYRPVKGCISADATNYTELDMSHFRKQIGVVQQNPMIFPGSILENLTYGHEGASDEEVDRALELALCKGFIQKLPQGLETQIARKELVLSAGELQKLAVARALLGNPRLLVLDEPSNHMDIESIQKIMGNIKGITPKPAVILISHNWNVIKEADKVHILHDGKITDIFSSAQMKEWITSGVIPDSLIR